MGYCIACLFYDSIRLRMKLWKPICWIRYLQAKTTLVVNPDPKDVTGFASFMERYKKGLVIEQAAVEGLK